MWENTPSWRQRFRISRGSVHILPNGTKTVYRMPCVTPIQVVEQADSKPMSNVFELHLPGRKIAGDLSKAWRKKINTVRRFASPRLWETLQVFSAFCLEKVSTNVTPSYLNDLKSKNSLLDTEDVATCLNKWLFCCQQTAREGSEARRSGFFSRNFIKAHFN